MATYKWGSYHGKVPAQIAGQHLSQLAEENGQRLTPRLVVDDARPIDAPLHPCFEWDDLRAAELHREDQARALIRGVRVVTQAQTETLPEDVQRVFVNIVEEVGEDSQHSYVPVSTVRQSDDLRQRALVAARRDFMSWRSRYLEIARIVGADQVQSQLDMLVSTDAVEDSAHA